ncbi:putative F-box/LRR-repeat protein 23 [Heracleum sosnowskyi]|uniref:F-box/LRR-repeat protein 23 n=1 Tax=Heracleum sosnowskyi TaxID=360622 RepID=A0AAD8I9H0_9APIA|nr:putative F-box/LRR-repeat protein 23 [Heracleum sosnowskyi]
MLKSQYMTSCSILRDQRPEENNRNWLNLPAELMMSILQRVGCYDVLMNAKKVCKSWHRLCKDPCTWRVVQIRGCVIQQNLKDKIFVCSKIGEGDVLQKMAMHVVDLSCGQLLDLSFHMFGSDHLLQYIYQRSSHLRRLRLESCYLNNTSSSNPVRHISSKGLIQMLENLPLLEELEFVSAWISGEVIEVAGRCCPHLKSFTFNQGSVIFPLFGESDVQAVAIAEHMPGLRHLQLSNNLMTITGLRAILKNCHNLESLNLRQCYNLYRALDQEPELETILRKQIKHVRFPNSSTKDYESGNYV